MIAVMVILCTASEHCLFNQSCRCLLHMIAVVVIVCIAMTHVTLTAIAEVERGIEIILQRGTYGRPFFSEKLHDQYLDMFEHISVGVSQRVGEP